MKVKIATLGCRNNQYESAEMQASFEKEGLQPVPFEKQADICVINTCSVTQKSNYRCRRVIRKTVESNPESFIIVTGCYPQLEPGAIKSLRGVDLILGNEEKKDIIEFLKELKVLEGISLYKRKQMKPMVAVGNPEKSSYFQFVEADQFMGKTKAFLKIQTGCNFKCSFCVITIARGNSRSADPANVVYHFKNLLNKGFKEITLTGIHLGSYGKDLSPPTNLYELLKLMSQVEGNFRIRLSSLGTKDINDKLISLIASSPKICNHLHISLQSGSNKILGLMKRNYRIEDFYGVVNKITNRIPEIGLGADLIAGFPSETDKDFGETMSVVKNTPFSYLHVFNFSGRKNTAAYDLPGQVPSKVRKKRVTLLNDLSLKKSLIFKNSFLEKHLKVLVEHKRDAVNNMLKGYSDNYLPVHFSGSDKLMNQIVGIRLSHLENDTLYGFPFKEAGYSPGERQNKRY